jgi:hypothetical protein
MNFRLFISCLMFALPAQAELSALWGERGERWTPQSRLPDFSQAGYRRGRTPPTVPVSVNVRSYGAIGDGVHDDSNAFLRAIDAASAGAVFIPAGRYRITRQLMIRKSGVVIRGAGRDVTTLYFPNSLTQMVGPGEDHAPIDSWSWSGGVIGFRGDNTRGIVSEVIGYSRRGDRTLTLASTSNVEVGQRVRLVLFNTDGSLGRHMHADQANAGSTLAGDKLVDFSATVTAITGRVVTLDRPLRTDVRAHWNPALLYERPTVEEVGIEDLTIEFPPLRYTEHHEEPGYNGIDFQGVLNGWARRVHMRNADSGVFLRQLTKFVTIDDVRLSAVSSRLHEGIGGHHGLLAGDLAQDNLFIHFAIELPFWHDSSVTTMAAGNVFMSGRAYDMSFDHHRQAPFENLYTDINAGAGTRMWLSGGDTFAGPHTGARTTFWNVRATREQSLPRWALQSTFVGLPMQGLEQPDRSGNWVETMSALTPSNLYWAQRSVGQAPPPPTPVPPAPEPPAPQPPNPKPPKPEPPRPTPRENAAPKVDAGPDLTVRRGTPIRLDGNATDDGLPRDPGRLRYSWWKISGPGDVEFEDFGDPQTEATFSRSGTYVLRFNASDGESRVFDTKVITVRRRAQVASSLSALAPVGAEDEPEVAFWVPAGAAPLISPNPWRSDAHEGRDLRFSNLDPGDEVKVFTLAGQLVHQAKSTGASHDWNLKTRGGDSAASGLYLYLIKTTGGDVFRGKLALIR